MWSLWSLCLLFSQLVMHYCWLKRVEKREVVINWEN